MFSRTAAEICFRRAMLSGRRIFEIADLPAPPCANMYTQGSAQPCALPGMSTRAHGQSAMRVLHGFFCASGRANPAQPPALPAVPHTRCPLPHLDLPYRAASCACVV